MRMIWNKHRERLLTIFISTLIWGLIAHGYLIFNKISYYDDAFFICDIGATIMSGRWMLAAFKKVTTVILGSSLFSLPLFNGICSLLLIAILTYLIANMFKITKKTYLIILSGCMVTFPQVTGMLFYAFTAPFYLIGTIMGTVGVYLISLPKIRKQYFVYSLILLVCSVGTYQANIPFDLSLMVLVMLQNENADDGEKNYSFWKNALKYVGMSISMLLVYLALTKLFSSLSNEALTDYQDINSFGITSLKGYLNRIILAYKEFFLPSENSYLRMYFGMPSTIYRLFLIFYFGAIIRVVVRFKVDIKKNVHLLILLAVFPLTTNFIFVMCEFSNIHAVMMYSQVLFLVCILLLVGNFSFNINFRMINEKNLKRVIIALLILLNVCNSRYANICYFKAELVQSHFVNYANRLIERIEETAGYTPDMKVIYVGEFNKVDDESYLPSGFAGVITHPYDANSIVNDYAWRQTMALWCGFKPSVFDVSYLDDTYEVDNMPCYPAEGSIKIIDEFLVVKFSEEK